MHVPFILSISPFVQFTNVIATSQTLWNKRIIFNGILFTSNSTILLSKIFTKIPSVLPKSANTVLCYIGITGLSFQIQDLTYLSRTFTQVRDKKEYTYLFHMSIKVSLVAISLFLTLSGSTLMLLPWFLKTTAFIPKAYALLGTVGLLFSCLEIPSQYANTALLKGHLKEIEAILKTKEEAVYSYLKELHQNKTGDSSSLTEKEKQSVQKAYWLLDRYSHENLIGILNRTTSSSEEKKHSLLCHLNKEKQKNKIGILKEAYGYTSLYLCKIYPNTLLQASLVWGANVIYSLPCLLDLNESK